MARPRIKGISVLSIEQDTAADGRPALAIIERDKATGQVESYNAVVYDDIKQVDTAMKRAQYKLKKAGNDPVAIAAVVAEILIRR